MGRKNVTQNADRQREATGSRRSGLSDLPLSSAAAANMPIISSTIPTTAKEPQCTSFRIFCRSSGLRQERIASTVSIKPSRCMKPVSRKGSAAIHAAASIGGSSRRPSAPSASHSAPMTMPTPGRQAVIRPRASSSQVLQGTGSAQNMLRHMTKAWRIFTAFPPCSR